LIGDVPAGPAADTRRSRGDIVAVIDIGSNSGRVMVFERDTSSHLRLLAGSRASLRLVHDVDTRGALSDATMARTTEALRDFQAIANRRRSRAHRRGGHGRDARRGQRPAVR
jgi:exopolyphosphatase/pppGpp-phosphohydrolase